MNREKAIRYLLGDILLNQIVYENTVIPVWDSKLEDDDADIYIIVEGQNASKINKYPHQKTWDCRINLSVISKQSNGVSRDIVDDVAEQIEFLLYNRLESGAVYNDWQISNFELVDTSSNAWDLAPSKTEVSKDLIFRLEASKTSQY